jgi:uncharacterized membrane protein SpoIIM required for sporulation
LTPDELIEVRRSDWDELERLIERVSRRGPRTLSGEQARRFVHLYREVSSDLARLQALGAEPDQLHGVNRLITRAHGQLYGRRPRARVSLLRFFAKDYPRLFRQRWRYIATSLAVFLAFVAMGYVSVQANPSVVADLLGGAEAEFRGDKAGEDIRTRFEQVPSPVLSSLVTTNNIIVAFTAYALGVSFGIGTIYLLMINGAMLGGFAGAYARNDAAGAFWETVMVHGALELTAIIIAAGAGLIMGYALWCPGRRTRLRALREEGRDAALIALGLVPAFMAAGLLEGFVTPAQNIPSGIKLLLGLLIMLVYWLYLGLAGRDTSAAPVTESVRRNPLR